MLSSWDLTSDPAFLAVTPRLGLTRNARRTRIDVTGRARLYPRRQNVPQFVQGNAHFQYRLSPAWTLGAISGGTRYRFASSRDSWWALPSLQWDVNATSSLMVRGGITERYVTTAQNTDRQPSGIVALTARTWLTDRLQAQGRLYWSTGRTSIADAHFGGTGASLRGRYWPTRQWSIETEIAAEQVQYETASASTITDYIGRGGVKTEWEAHSSVTLFAQSQALVAQLGQTDRLDTDVHVSVGLRVHVQQVLGGTAELPPRRRVCRTIEDGLQVQIPYNGNGTPHLTGDFNEWSLPGIPMTRANSETWTTTVTLPPGQYAYRIRIVNDSEQRWLNLPSYAQTAQDAFGGSNGVCTVP